ncbi:MAG: hypothetical protein HZB41_13765 [Ignavibacteriae bacterium]|nr:hypothetical protein [Ignavibacteriota bacterium]
MLIIKNNIDHDSNWSDIQREKFLKNCETDIGYLKDNKRLITAKPLVREGKFIDNSSGSFKITPINKTGETQVGYYHILANDLDDAIEIEKKSGI